MAYREMIPRAHKILRRVRNCDIPQLWFLAKVNDATVEV